MTYLLCDWPILLTLQGFVLAVRGVALLLPLEPVRVSLCAMVVMITPSASVDNWASVGALSNSTL